MTSPTTSSSVLTVILSSAFVLSYFSWNRIHGDGDFHKQADDRHRFATPLTSSSIRTMSMDNVTCHEYIQPLDHFSSSTSRTFPQRYCLYDGYVNSSSSAVSASEETTPIFFYTGNESPIDEYVNNTGLLWELASRPHFSALVVFAEHRFQGTSSNYTDYDSSSSEVEPCFTHLTTTQTLYDYVSLLNHLNPNQKRPVIVFGGSYGGMLSSWMRIKYPSIVAGAIASSAPIWGFPKTLEYLQTTTATTTRDGSEIMESRSRSGDGGVAMDGASRVVARALELPYPPTQHQQHHSTDENLCSDNLLATWPLMEWYSRSEQGRAILSDSLSLCHDLQFAHQGRDVIEWTQSPWFDLAEGDYPYPSSYIPFALGEGLAKLPKWPLQTACHSTGLNQDLGVRIVGDKSNVKYTIFYGDDNNGLQVDWDDLSSVDGGDLMDNSIAESLFSTVKDAVSIWFNVTGKLDCYDVVPAINTGTDNDFTLFETKAQAIHNAKRRGISSATEGQLRIEGNELSESSIEKTCKEKIENETVWSSIVCNENLNLIMTYAKGLGNDFYWPPSHPKDGQSYEDSISNRTLVEEIYAAQCADPRGIYGYPSSSDADPLSTFMDNTYGGVRIGSSSNIVFSNGLLDPWSAAGVFTKNAHDSQFQSSSQEDQSFCQLDDVSYQCSMVENITADGSIIALFLDLGGHHLDLMFSSDDDPPCAPMARSIEEVHIMKWIKEWREGMQIHGSTCRA